MGLVLRSAYCTACCKPLFSRRTTQGPGRTTYRSLVTMGCKGWITVLPGSYLVLNLNIKSDPIPGRALACTDKVADGYQVFVQYLVKLTSVTVSMVAQVHPSLLRSSGCALLRTWDIVTVSSTSCRA